jgi:F-type H+-transporting ATPase subunit alpha
MVNIRPDEISSIIREQIDKYDQGVQVANVGTVSSSRRWYCSCLWT